MTALNEGLERGIKAGYAFKADTIEELAQKIGVPIQNLVETVKDINAAADAGEDKMLGRPKEFLFKFSDHGPYYAMRGLRAFFQTLGGIRMNSKMQAMDKKGNVIPGLYAVGMDMGGLYDTSYDIKYPGFTSGFGMTGGLIAGRDAMRLALAFSSLAQAQALQSMKAHEKLGVTCQQCRGINTPTTAPNEK